MCCYSGGAILSTILNFRWTTIFFKTVGYSEPPCQISCLYHQMHDFSLICLAKSLPQVLADRSQSGPSCLKLTSLANDSYEYRNAKQRILTFFQQKINVYLPM